MKKYKQSVQKQAEEGHPSIIYSLRKEKKIRVDRVEERRVDKEGGRARRKKHRCGPKTELAYRLVLRKASGQETGKGGPKGKGGGNFLLKVAVKGSIPRILNQGIESPGFADSAC